jgi:hypothetical protein
MNVQALQPFKEPSADGLPFRPTLGFPFKVMGSSVLALLGVYYLARGKRDGEAGSMILGGALIVASFLVF